MIDENLAFVKDQLAYQQRQVNRYKGNDDYRYNKHLKKAAQFQKLVSFLESLPKSISAHTPNLSQNASDALLPSELVGLPEDLLKELSISESDKEAFEIIKLIDDAGGTMSLDRILIAIYRKTGEVMDRTKLNAKINRIMRKDMLWAIPGKKGVYTTSQPEENTLLADLLGE